MKIIFTIIFSICGFNTFPQIKPIPNEIISDFKFRHLDEKYLIDQSLKPNVLINDFNNDGKKDIYLFVSDKFTHKKGILILLGNSKQVVVFGAGKDLGKKGVDATNDLKWVSLWKVQTKKIVYEPKFNNDGDIIGSSKKHIPNIGISIWSVEDGEPIAGGVIFWNGKKWDWIHQGE